MSTIYVVQNVDTGQIYGGEYNQKYIWPERGLHVSDYNPWTDDLGLAKRYTSLKSAKSMAKRLGTNFKKTIADQEHLIAFFDDKIANPDDPYYGAWSDPALAKVHRDGHENARDRVAAQLPNELEGIEIQF